MEYAYIRKENMKVTGWTDWGNPKYIDIYHKGMEIRSEAINKAPKIPIKLEFQAMSETEQSNFFSERMELINELLDTIEIHKINNLCDDCYDAVLECVRDNKYHFTGDAHQNASWGTPIVDDKYIVCLSQRSWGGLIATAFPDEIDDSDGYGYIKWAWTVPEDGKDKVKTPNDR